MLGLKSFRTANGIISGIEVMPMVKKETCFTGQVCPKSLYLLQRFSKIVYQTTKQRNKKLFLNCFN